MSSYVITTDAFQTEIEAESLDQAIAEAFDGEIPGVHDQDSLERKFARYAKDGGWCHISQDEETVLAIGQQP